MALCWLSSFRSAVLAVQFPKSVAPCNKDHCRQGEAVQGSRSGSREEMKLESFYVILSQVQRQARVGHQKATSYSDVCRSILFDHFY